MDGQDDMPTIPAWKQISELFQKFGYEPPGPPLRDELVAHLLAYRAAEAAPAIPVDVVGLVERLEPWLRHSPGCGAYRVTHRGSSGSCDCGLDDATQALTVLSKDQGASCVPSPVSGSALEGEAGSLRDRFAWQAMLYMLDSDGDWPADKVSKCLAAISAPHSGDCTKMPWTCLRCCAEDAYKQADGFLALTLPTGHTTERQPDSREAISPLQARLTEVEKERAGLVGWAARLCDRAEAAESQVQALLSVQREMVEALASTEAWLDRWAEHVGACQQGDRCTCGLTAIRAEVSIALSRASALLVEEGDPK